MISTPPPQISIPNVPSYSQFTDIKSHEWQKVGCGVASLAMIIDYYSPAAIDVNKLLSLGIIAHAYDYNAGWTHTGLINLAKAYNLEGKSVDLSSDSIATAFSKFKKVVSEGPVMVSVHYKFDPKSTIPHLVVIDSIDADTVYYNDPAATTGKKHISTAEFLKGWKKRYIVIRPIPVKTLVKN